MTWIAATQPVFLAAVLTWSGGAKLAGRDRRSQVAGSALQRLLGGKAAVPVYVSVGAVEVAIAIALLAVPGRAPAVCTIGLSAGFAGYLGYSVASVPEASCGCLGAGRARVSWRSFGRVGLLLAAAVVAASTGTAWWTALNPVGTGALLAGEAAVFVGLSAELDRLWLTPLRKLRVRLTHPLAGAPDVVPLQATVSVLLRSEAYRLVSDLLVSDVREHWDADGWRILCYGVQLADRRATAVFAVPLSGGDPHAVRVSLVDEEALVAL